MFGVSVCHHILNLLLCNEPLLIMSVDIQSAVRKSDHASVMFQFSTRCTLPHAPQYNTEFDLCHHIYKWEDADYDSMNN